MLIIMVILVCLTITPHAVCDETTAVDIVYGPSSATPLSCLQEGMLAAAQMATRVVPGETYLKVRCRERRDMLEAAPRS